MGRGRVAEGDFDGAGGAAVGWWDCGKVGSGMRCWERNGSWQGGGGGFRWSSWSCGWVMELGEGGEWDEVLGAQWVVAGWRKPEF